MTAERGEDRAAAPPFPGRTVISVDAMGGDLGPSAVAAGIQEAAQHDSDLAFLVHGDEGVLRPLLRRLEGRAEIRHAPGVVRMDDKPSQVMRSGKDTSMWAAIAAVQRGEAAGAVSCGNTGALMAMAMLQLRKLPDVDRPAIACLWPSRGAAGFSVMLDAGADVRADAGDLLAYALMGAAYAHSGLGLERPRVGLLNVGTEANKGRPDLREAHELIGAASGEGFEYVGYVEGGDLPSERVDVVVTDGFTGNVALKTGEGTAKLISELLREAFAHTPLSRVAALLALSSLKRLQRRIDPRRVNGGVFLGLRGTVVKSHGSADATGNAAAIELAGRLARTGFVPALGARLALHASDIARREGAGA